ncbi:hypothetical protein GCM10009850_111450 [Nonomuraea monospora]|uniref:Shedu protein SduA C-terminal domain-containing protein n=2 Tax=Nonomuraea monospora TaxID=568818 RepID=A0ABN3D1K2_9ACTN
MIDLGPDEDINLVASLYRGRPASVRELIAEDESSPDVIALAHRRQQLIEFRQLLEDEDHFNQRLRDLKGKGKEVVWQNFLETNPWILGASLSGQLLTSWSEEKLEQVVAGWSVAGPGKRADGLLRTVGRIRSMVFVELKTHATPLLEEEPYRSGCWAPSSELAGGVSQVQGTVYMALSQIGQWLRDKDATGATIPGEGTYLIRPRSYLIIGQLSELFGSSGGVHEDRFRSFELYRRTLSEPDIITFDELLARAEWIAGVAPPR